MTSPTERAAELERARPKMLQVVPTDRIRKVGLPGLPDSVIDSFLRIPDMTCAVADVADEYQGVVTVASSDVGPVTRGARICGPALTMRYRPAAEARSRPLCLGDRDLYALEPSGSVAVLDVGGDCERAVIGELSAEWAMLASIAGIVVDGAVRDVESEAIRRLPVWSRGITPRSARGYLDTAELNGPVSLAGATVHAGDLIVADDNGIAVVPYDQISGVLRDCEAAFRDEQAVRDAIAAAHNLETLIESLQGKPPVDI